jgi:hypothetical protein
MDQLYQTKFFYLWEFNNIATGKPAKERKTLLILFDQIQLLLIQKKTRTVFEHVYNGTYCLAVYHGEWTSSLPMCNSEVPFYLETKLTELDVIQWNPTLNIQQHGSK